MVKKIILLIAIYNIGFAALMQEGNLYREKKELMSVKNELNDFYEKKELEYQKRKAELEALQTKIKAEEEVILKLRDKNQQILDEIKRVKTTKAMKLYDKMKLGVVVNIFNKMIQEGKFDEVFDIIIRMKEKRVIQLLKKLDTEVSEKIMEKMRVLKKQKSKQGGK